MSTSRTRPDSINAVIRDIGVSKPVQSADWGWEFAERLMDTGDDEAILYALADAGESYRSNELSRFKKSAREAVDRSIANGGKNGTAETFAHRQLSFPVTFEGVAPRPLIQTDHEFLVAAAEYAKKKVLGAEANLLFIERAVRLTAPFPGRIVGDLINEGLIAADAFAMERAA